MMLLSTGISTQPLLLKSLQPRQPSFSCGTIVQDTTQRMVANDLSTVDEALRTKLNQTETLKVR